MRKISIILLTIMLIWNVGLTQNNNTNTGKSEKTSTTIPTEVKKKDDDKTIIKVAGVTISEKTLTLTVDGKPQQLTVTIKPQNATNRNVIWSTKSQGRIASVSDKGEVTPVKSGSDTIIVTTTDGNKTDLCIVTVNAVVDSLQIFKSRVAELQIENQELEHKISDLIKKQSKIPDYVSYILIALLLGLAFWLFFTKKRANEKSAERKKQFAKFENELREVRREVGRLNDKNRLLNVEKDELEKNNQKLRAEIYTYQQKQKVSTNANEQSDTTPQQQENSISQPQLLYADAIVDGKFNRVKEQPDDDTIFQLKLTKEGDLQAKVIVYESAYRRVIARPSFLDGCEKQILGNSTVTMLREGSATKDESGKWSLTTIPEVRIS